MSENSKAVFLSYASQDAEAARRICDTLRAEGVEVWFDADGGLEHGDEWDAKIRRQIKECVLFIPLISANTQAREEGYFRLEWDLAAERARTIASGVPFILPVVIDDTREPDALVPDRFRMVQWTRLPGGVVTPEVKARYLKLWSHRIGAAKHESDVGRGRRTPPSGVSSAEAAGSGDPALQPKVGRRVPAAWIAAVAVAVAAVVGFFALRPTPHTGEGTRPLPAEKAAPHNAPASAPLSEARKLVQQARALIDDDWLAVRENFRNADDLCERATKLDPLDGEAWATWARVAAMFIDRDYDTSRQRRDAARSRAERALQLAPTSIEAGLATAMVLRQNNSVADATQRLKELLQRAPTDWRVARALAFAYSPGGKPGTPEGTELRLHHPSFGGRDPRPLLDEARSMHDTARQFVRCEELMAQANALGPSWEGYAMGLSYNIFSVCDLDKAVKLANELPPRLLQEDVFAALVAKLWIFRGDGEKARTALARVPRDFIEDRWFFVPTAHLVGNAYQLSNRSAAAVEQWKQALAVVEKRLAAEPNQTALLSDKALLLARLGRKEEALSAWRLGRELGTILHWEITEANIHLANGDRELAIDRIVRTFGSPADVQIVSLNLLRLEPAFAPIRSDPRIAEIIAKAETIVARLRRKPDPTGAKAAEATAISAPKSVAVLPFANQSDDKANESFAEGISEELGVVLSKVPGLRVTGWNSALSFKGKNMPEAEIAQKLGVTHIVGGSVQKIGTQVRITARLVNAADGFSVWSDSFRREAKDIFAVQDEIAGLIAQNLQLKLGVESRRTRTVNPEAHRLMLEGRHFWNQRNEGGFARAEKAFLQAIDLDPTMAEAHAGLAGVYVIRAIYRQIGETVTRDSDDMRRARVAAPRAVELDPTFAEAHAVLAYVHMIDRDNAAARRSFEQALQLSPNSAVAQSWFGVFLLINGRIDQAIERFAKTAELDPLWFINLQNLTEALFYAGRYEDALKMSDRALSLRSDTFIPHAGLRAQILFALGRRDEAVQMARSLRSNTNADTRWIADAAAIRILNLSGDTGEAQAYAAEVLERLDPRTAVRAQVLAAVGRHREALVHLTQMRPNELRFIFYEPLWDPFRNEPEFAETIAKLSCAAEYQTARETLARLQKEQSAKK